MNTTAFLLIIALTPTPEGAQLGAALHRFESQTGCVVAGQSQIEPRGFAWFCLPESRFNDLRAGRHTPQGFEE